MEVLNWLAEQRFYLIQTVGVVGGLVFTAHAIRKDERARTISNTIALNEQYTQMWHEFYERPALSRILKKKVDLKKQPVSDEETLFVKMLILHLDTVRLGLLAVWRLRFHHRVQRHAALAVNFVSQLHAGFKLFGESFLAFLMLTFIR